MKKVRKVDKNSFLRIRSRFWKMYRTSCFGAQDQVKRWYSTDEICRMCEILKSTIAHVHKYENPEFTLYVSLYDWLFAGVIW